MNEQDQCGHGQEVDPDLIDAHEIVEATIRQLVEANIISDMILGTIAATHPDLDYEPVRDMVWKKVERLRE